MKYLVHCIMKEPMEMMEAPPMGMEGKPVCLISENGVTAAVSEIMASERSPSVSDLLTYGNIIERFHRDRTVIPMRYGCLLDHEAAVVNLLRNHKEQYESLLQELDGLVEMGIRLLASARPPAPHLDIAPSMETKTGHSYLKARRTHYAEIDNATKQSELSAEQYGQIFSGLYRKYKIEPALKQSPSTYAALFSLSLFFLVPRESVDPFRDIFREMSKQDHSKPLLSGPWPPYNFSSLDHLTTAQDLSIG